MADVWSPVPSLRMPRAVATTKLDAPKLVYVGLDRAKMLPDPSRRLAGFWISGVMKPVSHLHSPFLPQRRPEPQDLK